MNKLNKIARVVHWGKFYPPDTGGIESVTASLTRGAAAAGYSVTVICFHKGKEFHADSQDGVEIHRTPILAIKDSQPIGIRYLLKCLGESRTADIVHLHAPNMLAALAVVFLGSRQKLVVHWHSDVVGKGWLGHILAPLEQMVLRRADSIVCTSQAYAEASGPLKPFLKKISVVPIGVPDVTGSIANKVTCVLPPPLDKKLEGARLVLALGRLVPYKGFDVLVDAAKALPADVVVMIVGSGQLQAELQQKIDIAGLADKVILAGRLDDATLHALYQRAELFCLPSVERSEAFGVVLVEAMSHGLPIVTTKIEGSGVPWVNSHGVSGLNVPVGDSVALADACNQILLSDELCSNLSAGARKRFEQEFLEEVSVGRMFNIYTNLLEHNKC